MIVDAHVALDEQRWPVEKVMDVLRRSRIESAVVFADAGTADLDRQNEYVLEAARRYDLFPFYYLGGNPWTDTRPDDLLIPDGIDDYAGIRWHRWIATGIDRSGELDNDELEWAVSLMESAEFEAFAAAAAHYNLPVLFEESFAVTLEFVTRYPALDIIVPHLGARSGGEATVLRALWDAPNVYFDTSLAQIEESTLARLGSERILFGSGFPEGDPEGEIDKIDRLPIPEELKEGIYGDNIVSLLSAYSSIM
ncbi:MAG: amidohydrolase family protein [Chloroflexota bacterium]